MPQLPSPSRGEPAVDPFGEHAPPRLHRQVTVLGGRFEFRSDHPELLDLVDLAYRGLPAHRLSDDMPDFHVELRLTDSPALANVQEPPEPRMRGGAGFLVAAMDAANLALVFPEARRGLVLVSRELLRFPYHARYELLEFVVFTLASRAQGLVPLHAGCVGKDGRGALLVGESGAGKSTLALHCLLQGLELLTEDATFVAPQGLQATGVSNFLHLRFDALDFLDGPDTADLKARIAASPVIRRRSGVEKYEFDLRQHGGGAPAIAPPPLTLSHVVFVSPETAGPGPLLAPLDDDEALERLVRTQGYAAQQAGWPPFIGQASRWHAHVLRRGAHPREAAAALRELLEGRLMT